MKGKYGYDYDIFSIFIWLVKKFVVFGIPLWLWVVFFYTLISNVVSVKDNQVLALLTFVVAFILCWVGILYGSYKDSRYLLRYFFEIISKFVDREKLFSELNYDSELFKKVMRFRFMGGFQYKFCWWFLFCSLPLIFMMIFALGRALK